MEFLIANANHCNALTRHHNGLHSRGRLGLSSFDFAHFVGTSDTEELNAIFYNKNRFDIDTSDYAKLSSASLAMPLNPKDDALIAAVPGFLPPALEPGRQLILAHLREKSTGKMLAVINTNLTFHRLNAREDQAYFITELARELQALDRPVVLTGDFNTYPNRPDNKDYPFYDGTHICKIFETVLKDCKDVALLGHLGPSCTSVKNFLHRNNRPIEKAESVGVFLDHIFASPEICILVHAVEACLIDGRFPSDHMPVIADILLP